MIYIYTSNQNSEKWILKNDWYFNLFTSNEVFTEEDKEWIKEIDHAELTENKRIVTKYGLGTVRNLSSGCKTLLNIVKNPDKVVNIEECGNNVLNVIFGMDRKKIYLYMSRPSRVSIADDVQICFNDKEIVKGQHGFEQWWTEEYARRESDDI